MKYTPEEEKEIRHLAHLIYKQRIQAGDFTATPYDDWLEAEIEYMEREIEAKRRKVY